VVPAAPPAPAATPAASIPSPHAAPPRPVTPPAAPTSAPAPTRPRGLYAVIAGLAAVAVVAVAFALHARAGGLDRGAIDQALAAGDLSLAQQRADALLAQHPGDAGAVAAVKAVVAAEAHKLVAEERFADALAALTERHVQRPWLAVDALEREVLLAQATTMIAHHHAEDGIHVFAGLRQRWPKDVDICRAMVKALADDDNLYQAIGAALQVAHASEGPLDEPTAKVLLYALHAEGAYGESMADLRALLAKRYPPSLALMHAAITDENVDLRTNACLLLAQAGQLGDAEALRHHLLNLIVLSSSYGQATKDALAWLGAAAAKPGWVELKRSAMLPPIDKVASLDEWSDHQKAVSTLLVTAFLPEIRAQLVRWVAATDEERLRWNAFTMLEQAGQLATIDLAAFHAATLATFNPLYESAPFTTALAFFRAPAQVANAAAAKLALSAGIAHVEKEIATYEHANMGSRAHTCSERLKEIKDALSTFK
jgi:hypothetical protein